MKNRENKTLNDNLSEDIEQKEQHENIMSETEEDVNMRNAHIAALETQLFEYQQHERDGRDKLLRAKAEIENIRRRTELEIEKTHKFALEKFSSDLLPVLDNLERALELADKNNPELTSMIEGVELTLKSLQNVANKYGIEIISDVDVPFNPDIHQAMNMIASTNYQPNYVISVMQKGYTLHGRLLRPAMVSVSSVKT